MKKEENFYLCFRWSIAENNSLPYGGIPLLLHVDIGVLMVEGHCERPIPMKGYCHAGQSSLGLSDTLQGV